MKSKPPRVTKKTIADTLGISVSTVDRALNGRGSVSPETRRRILKAAQELNYRVNLSARALSKRSEFTVGVVIREYPEEFWRQVEEGVHEAQEEMRDLGLQTDIIRVDESSGHAASSILEWASSGVIDAVALPGGEHEHIKLIDQLVDNGILTCTYNVDAPTSKRLFYVGCDYFRAGKLAAELCAKFIRMRGKVTVITDSWTSLQSQQKIMGFRDRISGYDSIKMIGPLKMDPNNWDESLNSLRPVLGEVDAIYVSNAEVCRVSALDTVQGKVVIGHDLNRQVNEQLATGRITAVITQEPKRQGYLSVKNLFLKLVGSGDWRPEDIYTKLEVIVEENSAFYL